MSCYRVTYMWATLLLAFSSHLKAECKWCFDGTTFEVKEAGNDKLVMISVQERDDSPIRSTTNQATLGVYLKWMYMGSAAGEIAPLFIVLAVDSMPEGAWYIHEVVGLSSSSDITRSGYVAFAKTRAGNDGLWNEYFIRFVIPTLTKSRSYFNSKVLSIYFADTVDSVIVVVL